MAYSGMKHRGYGIFEARGDELLVDFRAPRTALEPQSEVFTLQRFACRRTSRGSSW